MGTPLTYTNFQGNIKSGLETGSPGTDTRANARFSRSCSVSAASSANIMLPGDATLLDFRLILTAGSAGAGSTVDFGNTADARHYGAITNVSAAGVYSTLTVVSAQSLITQVGSDNILVVKGSGNNTNMLGVAQVTFSRSL